MVSGVLVGCNAGNDEAGNGSNAGMRDVGYYTDQNRGNNNADNPNTRHNMRNVNDRLNNNGNPANNNNDNLANNNGNANNYYNNNKTMADNIADQVSDMGGIKDAHVLINGDTVIVGVNETKKAANTQGLQQKVRTIVNSYTHDKQVKVVTDKDLVQRISDVNDNVANGQGTNEVRSDITGIINDIGDAAKRPFQNNNK